MSHCWENLRLSSEFNFLFIAASCWNSSSGASVTHSCSACHGKHYAVNKQRNIWKTIITRKGLKGSFFLQKEIFTIWFVLRIIISIKITIFDLWSSPDQFVLISFLILAYLYSFQFSDESLLENPFLSSGFHFPFIPTSCQSSPLGATMAPGCWVCQRKHQAIGMRKIFEKR